MRSEEILGNVNHLVWSVASIGTPYQVNKDKRYSTQPLLSAAIVQNYSQTLWRWCEDLFSFLFHTFKFKGKFA